MRCAALRCAARSALGARRSMADGRRPTVEGGARRSAVEGGGSCAGCRWRGGGGAVKIVFNKKIVCN